MSDDRDPKDDPGEQLKQGLGLLFRAAQGAAATIKKELDKSSVGKTLDDAGRDFARAANNVVERIASEITKKPSAPPPAPREEAAEARPKQGDDEEDDFDGVKVPEKKAEGGAPPDGGLRISIDDDDKTG
jgi:hypothetical protein